MTRTADFLAGFFCMAFMLAVLFWIYVASPPDEPLKITRYEVCCVPEELRQ